MFQSRRFAYGFLLALAPTAFPGCAVYMAAKGTPEPYGGGPIPGQDRNAVIANLGPPKQSLDSNGRSVEIYEYKTGDEPSPWRAVAHGVLDLSSFGVWEIIGTPIEMAQGEKVRLTVEYDEDGRVSNVSTGRAAKSSARIAKAEADNEKPSR